MAQVQIIPPVTEPSFSTTKIYDFDRVQWLQVPCPDLDRTFFWRKAIKATQKDANSTEVLLFLETPALIGNRPQGRFTLDLGSDIPAGTPVYVIIERKNDGVNHEFHYSRLPKVGKWKHWPTVKSFAIRVEWQDDNKVWKQKYLFHMDPLAKRAGFEDVPAAFDSFAQCWAVNLHLMQLYVGSRNRPLFLYNYGRMRVRSQEYIRSHQIMRFVDVAPGPDAYLTPMDKTFVAVGYELSMYGLNTGGPWGEFDQPCDEPRFPPGACDSCHLLNIAKRDPPAAGDTDPPQPYIDHMKPVSDPSRRFCIRKPHPEDRTLPDICESCIYLGRVCSWTRDIHYHPLNHPLITVLLPPPIPTAQATATTIRDPQIRCIYPHDVMGPSFKECSVGTTPGASRGPFV